jgi:hypothetical protein
MVQISISTIILAVLACVGPTLAAPITRDFSDPSLSRPDVNVTRDFRDKFHIGTVAHPVAPSPDRHNISIPTFKRAIGDDNEVTGRRHHKRGLLGTVKDKAQTAKDKAHRGQGHLDNKLLNDAKDLGKKSEKAVNRRRSANGLETPEQGESRLHLHNHGAPAHPAIPAPSRRDINDFVFERAIGDQEVNRRRHDRRGLLHTLEHKAQDVKKQSQKNQDSVNDALLTDAKGLGKKAKHALNRRRDLEDGPLRMSAGDLDENLP